MLSMPRPNGHSKGEIDSIAGESASELYETYWKWKQKQEIENHASAAKSYTDDELREIATTCQR